MKFSFQFVGYSFHQYINQKVSYIESEWSWITSIVDKNVDLRNKTYMWIHFYIWKKKDLKTLLTILYLIEHKKKYDNVHTFKIHEHYWIYKVKVLTEWYLFFWININILFILLSYINHFFIASHIPPIFYFILFCLPLNIIP